MVDVLGVVYDFIKTYACAGDGSAPVAYTDDQIIRGVQNATVAPEVTDFAVITHAGTVRHGTTLEGWPDMSGTSVDRELIEHIVQVDLYSAEPYTAQEVTCTRAQYLEMIARSARGVAFFEARGLSLLYADDLTQRASWDDTKNYTACYSTRLHISEIVTRTTTGDDYFTALNVQSIGAHTPATRTATAGVLWTENVDNNHT